MGDAVTEIVIEVAGVPQPAGSKTPRRWAAKDGRSGVALVDGASPAARDRHAAWRADVREAAIRAVEAAGLEAPVFGRGVAVRLDVTFRMPRPRSHYGTGRNAGTLKASAPGWPTGTPDRDKLLRAVQDALTGVVWTDDCQIVAGWVRKVFVDRRSPGASIRAHGVR